MTKAALIDTNGGLSVKRPKDASTRVRKAMFCEYCGRPIQTYKRLNAKYCCSSHKTMAWQKRRGSDQNESKSTKSIGEINYGKNDE
jgi:hypothetical protein